MQVIAMLTQKGGTGKSTLACSLAVAAQQAGEQVLAIDTDEQGTLAAWGKNRGNEVPAIAAKTRMDHVEQMLREAQIAGYTVVILDTPGRDTHTTMLLADLCLVPIRPTRVDAHGNMRTVQACLRAGRRFAFVLNQCATTLNNPRAKQMADGLQALGVLAPVMIGSRVDYQDAYALGLGVTEYSPEGKASEEIRQLWTWINGQAQRHTNDVERLDDQGSQAGSRGDARATSTS